MSSTRRATLTSGLLATAFLAITGFQIPVQRPVPNDLDEVRTPVASPVVVFRTDKTSYAPGEVVIFTSSGWASGEAVTLLVREEPPIHADRKIVARADSAGELFDNQFVAHVHDRPVAYYVTARGESSGRSALAMFGNTAVNLDQCGNGSSGTVACTGNAWQNGNLNSNQAKYFEGQSIPYRDVFTGLAIGVTYTKTISWDTTKSGKHAIDYLTSWDRNVASGSNPCSGVLSPCPAPHAFAVPSDPDLTAANGFSGVQIPGSFQCSGCDISNVSPYSLGGSYAGDSTRSATITFTASGANAVIAWGGHISDRRDWGAANSAVSITGSPYHTADLAFTCSPGRCSTGKQDRSVSAEAVVFPAKITVVKDAVPDSPDDFSFTTTGGLSPSTFQLDDDADPTLSNTQVFPGITTFATYTVTETDPSPFTLTGLTCTDDATSDPVGSTDLPTRTATITLSEGQQVTCKFTDTAPECSSNSDCAGTPATPVCDTATGTCVQCNANGDCSGSTPICNTSAHTCGGCTSDAQCAGFAATPVCDEGSGTCVQCTANSECSRATPICNTSTHTCGACTADAQCSAGTVCDETSGTCVQCTANSECSGATPICNTSTHTCGACTADAQCAGFAATPVCDEGSGTCVQCASDSHTLCTGTTPICSASHQCTGCTADAQCAAGTVCDEGTGACVQCTVNSECSGATPICNTSTHTCGACTADPQCSGFAATPVCDEGSGTCVQCASDSHTLCTGTTPVCSASHQCTGCTADAQCLAGTVCDEGTGACVQCTADSECSGATPICNTSTHTCHGCTADGECAGFAATPVCEEATGKCVECTVDSHALCTGTTPVCDVTDGGVCVECVASSDCSGATPICNTSSHTCQGCSNDGQCSGFAATPVCDEGSGKCVECTVDSHSLCTGSTPVCDVTDGGVCVECVASTDCSGATPICNTSSHTCEGCSNDGQCSGFSATPICDEASGHCVECTADSHTLCTGSTPFCDVGDGGICVQCLLNSDCSAATPVCDPGSHTCTASCSGDADCAAFPATPACSTSGSCVQCNGNEECLAPGAPLCNIGGGGVCVQCVQSSDCTAGAPVCNPSTHTCGACTGDADCAAFPATPACSTGGVCSQCNGNEDCTAPGAPVCNVGGGGLCVQCVLSSDCTPGAPVCNTSTHTCGPCTGDVDCAAFPATPACSAGGVCSQCNGNEDCTAPGAPVCNVGGGGICVQCVLSSDCTASAPVCNPSTHTCAPCTGDADCGSRPDSPFCGSGGSCVECVTDNNCAGGEICNSSGSCVTAPPREGKIAPTATTCDQFRLGTAADLTTVLYGVKATKINNVAPGVLFYYTHVSDLAAGSNTVQILQTRSLTSGSPLTPFFGVHQSQVTLYNASDCTTSTLRSLVTTSDGQTVTIDVDGATAGQDVIVGVKYNPSSAVGIIVGPIRPVVHYDFVTSLNGVTGETDPDGLDLRPKP